MKLFLEYLKFRNLAPALGVDMPINPIKIYAAKSLSGIFPKVTIPTGIDVEAISRIPEVVEAFRKDPLRVTVISLQTGFTILKLREIYFF